MGGKPKAPDTSAMDRERAEAEKERDRLKAENTAIRKTRKARQTGRSLLAFNPDEAATGKRETLG